MEFWEKIGPRKQGVSLEIYEGKLFIHCEEIGYYGEGHTWEIADEDLEQFWIFIDNARKVLKEK